MRLRRTRVPLPSVRSGFKTQKDQYAPFPACKLDYSLLPFLPWVSLGSLAHLDPGSPKTGIDELAGLGLLANQRKGGLKAAGPPQPRNGSRSFQEELWAQTQRDTKER